MCVDGCIRTCEKSLHVKRLEMASALTDATLLIGIMSYKGAVPLARRQQVRRLIHVEPGAAVRFVMSNSTPDRDAASPDMLLLPVVDGGRTLGTYLNVNAFFRYALSLRPRITFIGRADDDALFDPPTILAELRAFGPASLVYGPFHEWYQWVPNTMMPTCFGYSVERYINSVFEAHRKHRRLTPNASLAAAIPRFQRECLFTEAVGPYPFAKGPLVVYSRNVLRRLMQMPRLATDEAYAIGTRSMHPLRSPVNGKVYEAGQLLHPGRTVMFDDIYYGYLLLLAYAQEPMALIHARCVRPLPVAALSPSAGVHVRRPPCSHAVSTRIPCLCMEASVRFLMNSCAHLDIHRAHTSTQMGTHCR